MDSTPHPPSMDGPYAPTTPSGAKGTTPPPGTPVPASKVSRMDLHDLEEELKLIQAEMYDIRHAPVLATNFTDSANNS